MIKIYFIYFWIFCFSRLRNSLKMRFEEKKYFTIFFLLLQLALIFITCSNIYYNTNFSSGIKIKFLLGFVLFSVLINIFYRKYQKNKGEKIPLKFVKNIQVEIAGAFKNLMYFNKGTFYFVNTITVKIEKKLRPIFLNPYKLLKLVIFYPHFIILTVSGCEILFLNTIYFSLSLFLLNLFFYRIFFFVLEIISIISKNSCEFNFNQILSELNFESKKQNEKDKIFIFLDENNLSKFVTQDKKKNLSEKLLLNKFLIIFSILNFAKSFILGKIYSHLIPKYKFYTLIHFFISLSFFSLIKKTLNEPLFVFFVVDEILFFVLFNFWFINFFFKNSITRTTRIIFRKLLINADIFLEDIKLFYEKNNFIAKEKFDIISPRSILFKFEPIKPKFFEAFEDLPFNNINEDEEENKAEVFSYAIMKTVVLFMFLIILVIIIFKIGTLLDQPIRSIIKVLLKNLILFLKLGLILLKIIILSLIS